MSRSTAIGLVSQSLKSLLTANMVLLPKVPVTLLAPDETGGDRRLNLFLYKITEVPTLRNMDWQVTTTDPGRLTPPPLSLCLHYLMTAYAPVDTETGDSTAQEFLGDAMRVFAENAVIPDANMPDDLKGAREKLEIIPATVDINEMASLWGTFSQPYRLSVAYDVSVVQIDMLAESQQAMAKRVTAVGAPLVRAPYNPPAVEGIDPSSGAPGSTVTFRGRNLAGWKAYVTVMGRPVVDGQVITAETFAASLPHDLPGGFHEITVDVSHLCRGTFFFEVT